MKAFILAAGLGTRLKPLTDNRPKVMVEVGGKKILERTISQLKQAGIDDLVINTHYFPEAVPNYFGDGSEWGVKIKYSFEPVILGTAGGLKQVESEFTKQKEFLVIYGDNVFDLDFNKFIRAPFNSSCLVMLFDRTQSQNSGIAGGVVEVNADNLITGFFEGVNRPELSLVNGGVYKCTPDIFRFIPGNLFYDFGKQVFPKMLENSNHLQAYVINAKEALFGVDNLTCLEKANKHFSIT